jgi:hypothetical protein
MMAMAKETVDSEAIGPQERERAPENGPIPSSIVIGTPLLASEEVRAGIEYAVSGSRCAHIPPRERSRHGIGVESRLRPQSCTRM